jgi:hypothetical protein
MENRINNMLDAWINMSLLIGFSSSIIMVIGALKAQLDVKDLHHILHDIKTQKAPLSVSEAINQKAQ